MRYARFVAGLVVLLSWCGAVAWADYVNPPPWQGNPYYTHQSWDFNTSANPLIADGGYSNPYGTPQGQLISGMWVDVSPYYPPTRTGWWFFAGPHTQEDELAKITIPNTPHPELIKEIWLQAVIQTNIMDIEEAFDLRMYPNGQGPFVRPAEPAQVEVLDLNLGLARVTVRFVLDQQPAFEVLDIRANMQSGEFFAVDQLDIDTRCIPEPASVVLALLAAPALLVFWRRKR